MSPLNDLLPAIDRLRDGRDLLGQQVYALRTKLARIEAALRTSRENPTRLDPPDAAAIAAVRAEIASLEAALRDHAASEQSAIADIARFDDAGRRVDFLARSLDALQSTLESLNSQQSIASSRRPPDREIIEAIDAAIATAESQLAGTERSLETERAALGALEQAAIAARDRLTALAAERARLRAQIDVREARIAALLAAAGSSADELETRRVELNKEYATAKEAWKDSGARLHDAIVGIYVDQHPRAAVAQMSDATPFLLLPLRIEARFMTVGARADARNELWLRVYPDDIAVHTHEGDLTDREVAAGETYWRSIFAIEKGAADDKGSLKTEAWKAFAILFGPSRSAHVARRTRPTNWAHLAAVVSADDLAFPVHDLTKTASWTRAPRTQVMPDRFVAMLYMGDAIVREVVGNVVPDELVLGPEPLDLIADADDPAVDDSFVTVDGQLTFGPSYDWASNFDRAVESGMGFRIPIADAQAESGFDKILVLGVMASATPETGERFVEDLLANHQHSPKGLSLLQQGAATNNVEGDGSGYSTNDSLTQVQEVTGLDVPLFDEQSDTDGRRLARALGINDSTLHFVFNSDNTDYRDAVAMNRALYPGTLGYYFDSLLRPILTDATRDRLRAFFVDNVTGRGPIAPIRIDDQPYGILLTSDFTNWKEDPRVVKRDPFLGRLYTVLRHFDAIWTAILPELMYAGKPGVGSDEVLMNVLGLQPGSVSFVQRVGYNAEYLSNLAGFQSGGTSFGEAFVAVLKELYMNTLLRDQFGYQPPPGDPPRSDLFRLIYQHFTTALDAANLTDNVPLSESNLVREYDTVLHKNYLHWLHETGSVAELSAQNFGTAPAPTALLYLKLRHALILQLHKSAVTWMKRFNLDASATNEARTFYNVRPAGNITRWEVLRTPVSSVDPTFPDHSTMVADFLMSPTVDLDETIFLGEMRDALGTLAELSTARLERVFTEHIDACTYRLDAWQTALFKGRLDTLRTQVDGGASRTGTYLGAFGWLEDVRRSISSIALTDVPEKLRSPSGKPLREFADNGGFIHAPSINQATAAALLRSGYMSHATPENPDVMAVNLSSERVRRAQFILGGMRNGQSLEALLGYQFERGLHDRASADSTLGVLNAFIVDIRIAFPIRRVRIAQGASGGAEETVESYDVVNGLALAETAAPDWVAILGADAALLTPPRVAALNGERDKLADTLDAVTDLLMSESAYQMVQGNVDRAGAVLESLKDAHVPPDLDVIKTPRSSHFTFTHRVAIHFPRLDPTDPSSLGWPGIQMTPRALLEPGVNQWLGIVLGDPEKILATVFETDEDGSLVNPAVMSAADLALQPIDLVYMVGPDANTGIEGRTGASELESRIAWRYRADHALDETSRIQIQFGAPKNQPGTATMAEVLPLVLALQKVLAGSRPLDARDYHTSTTLGGTPSTGYDFADIQTRATHLQTQLGDVIGQMHAIPFAAVIDGTAVTTLGGAFTKLLASDVSLATLSFTFAVSDTVVLQQLLIRLTAFGLPDVFPRVQNAITNDAQVALVAQAMEASAVVVARLAASTALLAKAATAAPDSVERAVGLASDACKAILGSSFSVLPAFALDNEADLTQSDSDRAQLLAHATGVLKMASAEEEWMRGAAYVRPRVAAWERIRLLHETLIGETLDLRALQLPYRPQDSWLAVQFPEVDAATGEPFDITRDTLSVVAHGQAAFATGSLRCGILIDDWTETIPAREQSTGIAFHYNRPNAMPPQALLLAIPPEMTGSWSWDVLVNILNDTLRRAKLRAVEPYLLDQRSNVELGVLLPAIIAEFQQYDLNVSLDLRLNLIVMAPLLSGMYLNPNLS
ncbi:MAG: hypothetical protein ABI877_00130 [Gemmatimonadaceae bacterium]